MICIVKAVICLTTAFSCNLLLTVILQIEDFFISLLHAHFPMPYTPSSYA